MSFLYEFVEILTSFIEVLILMLIGAFFANKRFSSVVHYIVLIGLSISITALTLLLNQIELVTLVFLPILISIWTCAHMVLYKGNFIRFFAVSTMYIVIITAFDFCANSFIELFFGKYGMTAEAMNSVGLTRTILILSYKAVLITAFVVIAIVRRGKPAINMSTKNSILLAIVGVVLFLCMYFLMIALATGEMNEIKKSIFFAWFFLLMFVFGAIALIIRKEKERGRAAMEQILENKIDSLENQITQSIEAYKNIAELSHDHKNHLQAILLLLENQKNNEAKDYIERITKISLENDSKIASVTGIDSVDAIINIKRTQCRNNGISFSIDSSIIAEEHISSIDFCSLLMNLLDNAIEAVMRIDDVSERRIDLKISVWDGKLMIKVSNSFDPDSIVIKDDVYLTSKEKSKDHGYGIMIIKRIVEANGGVYSIKADEDFCVSVLI